MMPVENLKEYLFNTASREKWERVGPQKRAGVLVPLFSVYSRQSLGVGDFADLKLLIDWAALTGNSLVQLLPLNETGATFCPYDAVSSFALEPAYISLEKLPGTKNNKFKLRLEAMKKKFPAGRIYVDYGIKEEKIRLLRDIFLEEDISDTPEFKLFRQKNQHWLNDFALYKVLKKEQAGRAWYDWEEKYQKRDPASLESLLRLQEKEISFQMWLQWVAFKQLEDAKNYAAGKNILLQGDLPILISRDSADVWARRGFFKLEFASGAPPDMYCAKGQRWGMPTYHWEAIAADNYRYLKEKISFAGNFYDILRIDHVVGLFRIWTIPYHEPPENQGLNGCFDPQDENKWGEHGRKILTAMLAGTEMLLCAEDLGVIPDVCKDTLKELGIPGNDVSRWTKDWKVKHDFFGPEDYRLLSVAMLSVHDSTNWPDWWENEAETVDEALIMKKCYDHRQINFQRVKDKLFDFRRSRRGRLRWRDTVDSVDKLVEILDRNKEELADFIDLYVNTYQEKEKIWKQLGLKGKLREKCDREIIRRALELNLKSNSVFCINTIIDLLYLADIFKGDPYLYRINTPGTVSDKNWSLVIPLALEDLLKHRINKEIRQFISSSGRI